MTVVLITLFFWLGYLLGRKIKEHDYNSKIHQLESDLAGWRLTAKRQTDILRADTNKIISEQIKLKYNNQEL